MILLLYNLGMRLKLKAFGVSIIFTATVVMNVLTVGVASAFSGSGSGTSGDPFQITTCVQLQEMDDDLDAHYRLMNNIDCSATSGWNAGAGFEPVGSLGPFTGTFDGQGFEIHGLFINRTTTGIGLFDTVEQPAEIRNVGLVDADITGKDEVGTLAGRLNGSFGGPAAVVENATASGSASGEDNVGGLVGWSDLSEITDSHADVTVTGTGERIGGLLGFNDRGTVARSYASGAVSGAGAAAGGLVGNNSGDAIIRLSYATGNVTGADGTGGLAGNNLGLIEDSYATGNATGASETGGLTGDMFGSSSVSRSFSVGTVTGTSSIGGLSGYMSTVVEDSFWNTETSGQSQACGSGGGDCTDAVGKTTGDMKILDTFSAAGWSITTTTTNRNNGYPFLSWEIGDSTPTWYIYVNPDIDGDGIPASVEDAAPNGGDANNDGTADSTQENVTSFVSPLTNKYVVLAVDAACQIDTTTMAAESSNSSADVGFDYPAGLMNFTADCGTPGYTTTVTQYFYGVTNTDFILRKYHPGTHAYFTVSGAILAHVAPGGQAAVKSTYTAADGGSLDTDGTVNGIIVDPVGLAQSTLGVPNTGLGGRH
jgi:hypothetical protein